jgi:hypothetical protein
MGEMGEMGEMGKMGKRGKRGKMGRGGDGNRIREFGGTHNVLTNLGVAIYKVL